VFFARFLRFFLAEEPESLSESELELLDEESGSEDGPGSLVFFFCLRLRFVFLTELRGVFFDPF
jgi:hypothetical protein